MGKLLLCLLLFSCLPSARLPYNTLFQTFNILDKTLLAAALERRYYMYMYLNILPSILLSGDVLLLQQ